MGITLEPVFASRTVDKHYTALVAHFVSGTRVLVTVIAESISGRIELWWLVLHEQATRRNLQDSSC
jgi:hypothetical protein